MLNSEFTQMDNVLVFDHISAMNRIDGDMELMKELVEIFLEDHKNQLSSIEAAIEKKDAYSLDRAAHSIKSALGNLGAMKAHATALALEIAGKENQLSRAPLLYVELEEEIQSFLHEVLAFINKGGYGIES